MRSPDHKQSSLFSYTHIEESIAADHPLRRIKVMADMVVHSMSPTFDSLYAEGGRPSIAKPPRALMCNNRRRQVRDAHYDRSFS